MPDATTAMVFVDKAWYDNTLRILLKRPTSTSTNGVHVLIGELRDDTKDPVGIWFKDVPNPQEGVAGGRMELLVPWRIVLGVALLSQPDPRKIGFDQDPNAFTVLK
jgi:hypothetical protein